MHASSQTELVRLREPLERVKRRLAGQRALDATAIWGRLPLIGSLFWGIALHLAPDLTRGNQVVAIGLIFVLACVAATQILRLTWRHPSNKALALRVDRAYGSRDPLTNALQFAQKQASVRSPLEQAVIERGLALAKGVDPAQIAPFRRPKWGAIVTLLLAQGGVLFLPVGGPRKRPESVPLPPPITVDMPLPQEVVRTFEESVVELGRRPQSPQIASYLARLERLAHDLKHDPIQATSAAERLAGLTAELDSAILPPGSRAMDAFAGLGRVLAADPTTQRLGKALQDGHASDALDALKILEERLASKTRAPSVADLERLRKAIEREHASLAKATKKREQEAEEIAQAQQSLVRNPASQPATTARDRERGRELERRLEHLNREKRAQREAEKPLTDLDRALAQAAEALRQKRASKFDGFSAFRQDLKDVQARELNEAEKLKLLEELRRLGETLREAGPGNELKQAELEQFARRAEGQPDAGNRSTKGDTEGQPAADANAPTNGPRRPVEQVTLNPLGETVVLGASQQTTEEAATSGDATAQKQSTQGPSSGNVHDENVRGDGSHLRMRPTSDVTAVSAEDPNATVSAEVVSAAAQRGFSAKSYAQVYRAYEPVRESLLERPDVPKAKRSQVRRYFQMIRPRGTTQ